MIFKKKKKKLYDPFLWVGFNCLKATELLQGDSLLFFFYIYYTCYSLVKLFRHLLSTSHKYSCLGKFATDILEKELTVNNTRALVVLACFISVQQVIEKVQIKQSLWLLLIDMK